MPVSEAITKLTEKVEAMDRKIDAIIDHFKIEVKSIKEPDRLPLIMPSISQMQTGKLPSVE